MKRRSFLKSLAALAAVPALPSVSALSSGAVAVGATPTVPAATYKWAEVIVRAHNSCSPAMLQRLLSVDAAAANILQKQLVSNGVVSAQANAYGIRNAMKPLADSAFLKPGNLSNTSKASVETAKDLLTKERESAPLVDEEWDADHLACEMREAEDVDCAYADLSFVTNEGDLTAKIAA